MPTKAITKGVEKQLEYVEVDWFYNKLVDSGMSEGSAEFLNMLILLIVAIIVSSIAGWIARKIFVNAFGNVTKRTKTKFDDYLVENKALKHLAKLIPFALLTGAIPIIFIDYPRWQSGAKTVLDIYLIIIIIQIVRSILYSIKDYLMTTENFRDKPVQSYIQVVLIFLYIAGFLIIFSMVTGKSVIAFLTALGAASAILLLVFKDTILGFVASIQISSNDMVRIGDWIEMTKYGANGDVIEINLATVKVQNWDKTITTIPTYALISDSFKNWRGMQHAGGRRIKRSINIKISSIRHITPEDAERLQGVQLISKYIKETEEEIKKYNKEHNINDDLLINGRHLTNLGVFRKYMEEFIGTHPFTHKDMTMMVRHLEPTTQGIPIELYAFATKTEWEVYEAIMADMFDHLLASIRYFDLDVYEQPAADDIRYLKNTSGEHTKEFEDADEDGTDTEESTEQEGDSDDTTRSSQKS